MKSLLFAVLVVVAPLVANAAGCQDLEAAVQARVATLATANDDVGAFRTIGDEALTALKQCPQSARLWYLAARSAEVLEGPMAGRAFAGSGGLAGIVHEAVAHHPRSAPIATIAARLDGTTASARKAVALDSSYAPARRALATALARDGAVAEALRLATVESARNLDHLARAKVLLAAGRAAEAVTDARKALAKGNPDTSEPAPSVELQREAYEVLGFAYSKQGKTSDAEKAFRIAAAAGSTAAQAHLRGRK